MNTLARLDAIEAAIGELGDRVRGIHTAERFAALMPAVAPYVETHRQQQAAARAAQAAAAPEVTLNAKRRYAPITSALLAERERGD